jgi:uncharacterized protein with NRDE domain
MCTVSYIPVRGKTFFTSNRDEKLLRPMAEPTALHLHKTGTMAYPRDTMAGGSWFALHENGWVAVLLNGALEKHIPRPPYRRSRGLILLDILDTGSPLTAFGQIHLKGIEPFTLVLWEKGILTECRWDGTRKDSCRLDSESPHIWSSATLYEGQVVEKRRSWFQEWVDRVSDPSLEDVLNFHQFTGEGNPQNDLLMNRDDLVLTVSITGAEIGPEAARIMYLDTRQQKSSDLGFSFRKTGLKEK